MEWNVFEDAPSAARACAERAAVLLRGAIERQPFATLAVSGGSTPRLMFGELARMKLDWERIQLFWVDERCVPPGDKASNYRLVRESLIEPAGIAPRNVHRVEGELAPEEAVRRYMQEIARVFGTAAASLPHFDVVHLGIGADAHTASLFPGSPLTRDREGIAAAAFAPQFNQWRVTLLPGVLEAARHTLLLASGADKRQAIRNVLDEPHDPLRYPAQIAVAKAEWFLDRAAAGDE